MADKIVPVMFKPENFEVFSSIISQVKASPGFVTDFSETSPEFIALERIDQNMIEIHIKNPYHAVHETHMPVYTIHAKDVSSISNILQTLSAK